ncbi:hypothetical protein BCR34DRAFT_173298 [Clohesyomyces aquaticus]|uniref:Uncharacterized protein n=1 Tax=Clohesyomyces aquaticus TaxID=1231657 RepID=A0A1Y1YGS2_9PLEO|nr:hypothetical protein BCR34DRAFT_173298 [Clohesyomyces aquaticus]
MLCPTLDSTRTMSHDQPLRSDSMAKLNPHPNTHVDPNPTAMDTVNHQAASHLLDPQPHQQTFNGYDGHDVRALRGDFSARDKPSSSREDSATVLWKGIPPYLLTWELLGIVLSAGFLVLGACVASLEGQPQGDWSERIIQATKLAPSVWPIVFSGVVGGAVRIFAEWRVERGIPLLALEQLLGSLSMASSIITIFRWSIFRFSSAALILLWAFDPLGSQASFRAAYLQSRTGTIQGSITAYNPNLTTQLAVSTYQSASTRSKPVIRALYSASLYDYAASTQYVDPTNNITQGIITTLGGPQSAAIEAATDTWGNVRVPNLEYLSNYNESQPHQWLKTPWDQQVLNYSSLLGERVNGIDRNFTGNTTFMISSSYQRFMHSMVLP